MPPFRREGAALMMNTAGHREKSGEQILTNKNEAWSSVSKAQGASQLLLLESSCSTSPTDRQGAQNLSVRPHKEQTGFLYFIDLFPNNSYKRF